MFALFLIFFCLKVLESAFPHSSLCDKEALMRTSESKETEFKRRGGPRPPSRIELEFLGLEVETLYDCITDIPHPSRLRKMRRTQNRSFLTKLLKDAFTSSTNTQKLFSRSVSNQHQVKVLVKRKSPTERWMGNDPTGSCLSHPRSRLSQNNQRTSCRGRAGQVSCC